jgi:murein L,D-transpeptidase YcbB/YkuD
MMSRNDLPIFNPVSIIILMLVCLLLLFTACRSGYVDRDDFSSALQEVWKPTDTTTKRFRTRMATDDALALAYQYNGFGPLWTGEKGLTKAVDKLLEELEELEGDGLDTGRYHIAAIRRQASELEAVKRPELAAAIAFDTLCTRAYLQASRDLLLGQLSSRNADPLWYNDNDSAWNAALRLATELGANGDYPRLNAYRSRIPTYGLLQEMLRKHKQDRRNIDTTAAAVTPDSLTEQVRVNLERLRWLPQEWEKTYILVNIPQMELVLREDGKESMRMRVVVGRNSRQTPALSKPIANIVFNPSWGVPPTILEKDVLPGLTEKGAAYLQKKNLRAYDKNGNPVDAGSIDESNYQDFVYRQPPGDDNALGVIKFNMPNVWNIYLHDTPDKSLFSKPQRDKSSGCVRVEHAKELAAYMLTRLNGKSQFTPAAIDSITRTRETHYEQLEQKLPVHLVYLTAFEDESGGSIRLFPDIYDRDRRVAKLLERK